MGKERDNEYYDEIYKKSHHYSLHTNADSTIYKTLYNLVERLLKKDETILELGCGTGQFAEKLINNKYNYLIGIDFSSIAIEMCNKRCPSGRFLCEDINTFDINSTYYDTIVSLETMEHIEKDIEILSKIKGGKRIILSLPSFDDPAHVRFFPKELDIKDYYKSVLSDMIVYKVERHFVVDSISQ